MAAWDMIRDLVGSDPALNQAAWENLSGILGLTAGDRHPATEHGYFEFWQSTHLWQNRGTSMILANLFCLVPV
jgi:hypothetical protein